MTTEARGPRLVESRRLTGANLLIESAGSVLDVALRPPADAGPVVVAWRHHLTDLLEAVGWGGAPLASRRHEQGISFAFAAPIDALYAACDVHEAAWARVVGADDGDDEAVVARLRETIAAESDPALLALREAARARGVAFLWDDDEVSLGLGCHARTWARGDLPAPADVDWDAHGAVPVVLVTGTNGKSTTVRMLARVLEAHGPTTGSTSTDGIVVGGKLLDPGDWSGPGGARTLLRDRRVEAGVLEVARGGLLRRGLPVERADAAIVTNVAADHLGEYGIHTLDDLAEAKLLVGIATRPGGVLVLNADDDRLVAHAPRDQRLAWTSLDARSPVVRAAVDRGELTWVLDGGAVVEVAPAGRKHVLDVAAVPATLGGAARHNVANVLGATALARSLGVAPATIASALAGFRSDADDNPGRANLFAVGGATALVDFAHNPHGMTAILDTARRLDGDRLLVHVSQAGDRSDADMAALARTVWAAAPALVVVSDVPDYLRGREPGEVPAIIRDALLAAGAPAADVVTAGSPPEGIALALDRARPGDLLCLMVLSQKDEVRAILDAAGATPRRPTEDHERG